MIEDLVDRLIERSTPSGPADLIVRISSDGRFLDVGASDLAVMQGVAPRTLVGRRVRDLFPGRVWQQVMDDVREAIQTGAPLTSAYEVSWPTATGQAHSRVVPVGREAIVYLYNVQPDASSAVPEPRR